jgi:hypothetical protein
VMDEDTGSARTPYDTLSNQNQIQILFIRLLLGGGVNLKL